MGGPGLQGCDLHMWRHLHTWPDVPQMEPQPGVWSSQMRGRSRWRWSAAAAWWWVEGKNRGGKQGLLVRDAVGSDGAVPPPRDEPLRVLRKAGGGLKKMVMMIWDCCRFGSSLSTSVGRLHCKGAALAWKCLPEWWRQGKQMSQEGHQWSLCLPGQAWGTWRIYQSWYFWLFCFGTTPVEKNDKTLVIFHLWMSVWRSESQIPLESSELDATTIIVHISE